MKIPKAYISITINQQFINSTFQQSPVTEPAVAEFTVTEPVEVSKHRSMVTEHVEVSKHRSTVSEPDELCLHGLILIGQINLSMN